MGAELFAGQSAQEKEWELPTSEKARGKARAVESPSPETDAVMAQQLQDYEGEAEQVRRGQDAATLVAVREAAGLLMQGQVEGLGAPS